MSLKITIIGGGNLGTALALGLQDSKVEAHITVTRRQVDRISYLLEKGIAISAHNTYAIEEADMVILALKPFQVFPVLQEISTYLSGKTVISLATGVTIADMEAHIQAKDCLVLRAMPNTAIEQRESVTCLSNHPGMDATHKAVVQQVFEAVGQVIWIDEKLFDAATVLGACGIAYVMRFIRAMMQGGIQIGFDSETALRIAAQTVKGAATILLEEDTHPEREVDKVTTPRGCTIAGLNEMEHQGFSSALIKGIQTSYHEIADIKKEVGEK
jgi:pyrroline-5-carboxylate reductase